jgi:hypothetical protein
MQAGFDMGQEAGHGMEKRHVHHEHQNRKTPNAGVETL